jgi:hypothetical protein
LLNPSRLFVFHVVLDPAPAWKAIQLVEDAVGMPRRELSEVGAEVGLAYVERLRDLYAAAKVAALSFEHSAVVAAMF